MDQYQAMNDNWDDGDPGEDDSLTGETDQPIPWRSWLTARMPYNRKQIIAWRMPVWLFLVIAVISVIIALAVKIHGH